MNCIRNPLKQTSSKTKEQKKFHIQRHTFLNIKDSCLEMGRAIVHHKEIILKNDLQTN